MKQLFIKLKDLIKRGILRIFPLPRLVGELCRTIVFVIVSALLISCGTQRQVTQLVERTSVDTVYLSNTQYDSIYIYKDRSSEYHLNPSNLSNPSNSDTLYIKDVSIEYRYKMLRDTIYKTQVDSIPYQVTVTEVKEITRPLTWYDHLTRVTFWFVIGSLLSLIVVKLRKYFFRP